jgi:hypothetical protein
MSLTKLTPVGFIKTLLGLIGHVGKFKVTKSLHKGGT